MKTTTSSSCPKQLIIKARQKKEAPNRKEVLDYFEPFFRELCQRAAPNKQEEVQNNLGVFTLELLDNHSITPTEMVFNVFHGSKGIVEKTIAGKYQNKINAILAAKKENTVTNKVRLIRTFEPLFLEFIAQAKIPHELGQDAYNELCVFLLEQLQNSINAEQILFDVIRLSEEKIIECIYGGMTPVDHSIGAREYSIYYDDELIAHIT